MEDILKQAKEIANELLKKKPLSYHEFKELIPETQGIYLVYKKNNGIIYIGKAKVLKRRVLADHISGEVKNTTGSFRKELTKEPYNLNFGNEMCSWIKENCLFCWVEIEDKDLCHLVESFLIIYLRRKGENLFNS